MPFIEIITDAKSQSQLSKAIKKRTVKNADIFKIKKKNSREKKYVRNMQIVAMTMIWFCIFQKH